ncbi:AcrR family transcriptional regulator [Sphingobium sp. B1D7B]|uniref:TetR/AcrR family transcriptional regulator n=1 Tax=unclassified Sphingobium TaxID=2611147 RepID=UPI0022257CE2|nr:MULTISPECIES: TetR/AcrR family transcriptional regulator [unclassified Sphingobium]MCW2392694.1 AcrR family transcriptional regulator [Sphingobium sp. B11D3A]MCW2404389.1 AcrR family transcriptional regulator [Sphingobium sp. B1D7B]
MSEDLDERLDRAGAFPAQQERSKQMRDMLIESGLSLAKRLSYDQLSVARICAEAGCSTGAFYARFPDKKAFFKALIVKHAISSRAQSRQRLGQVPFDDLLNEMIASLVRAYMGNAVFLRSAIQVSLEEPEAWEPFRRNSHELADFLIERIKVEPSIVQSSVHEPTIRFAVQVLLGTLNNALINRPGPIFLEDPDFPILLRNAVQTTMSLERL